MHIVTLFDPAVLGNKETIEPGTYLAQDLNAAQLVVRAGDGIMTPLTETRPLDETKDYNGKRILIARSGGFGDLTLMTPVFREIKRRWPNCILSVSCFKSYSQVLQGLPYIDNLVGYPIPKDVADKADVWILYEKAIEKNPRAHELHMTDLFAEIAGLTSKDWTADKKPEYRVTSNEIIWAFEQAPRDPAKRRVCIQATASARCRVYPMDQIAAVVQNLVQSGWEVFMLGEKNEIGMEGPPGASFRNMTTLGLSFRQSCAILNNSDALIGNDSALLHIAGALEIPAIGLYGPFPGKLRTSYCPTTTVLSEKARCAPCFHHMNPSQKNEFPEKCPSGKKPWPGMDPRDPRTPRGFCEVLAKIKPVDICQAVKKHAKKFELKLVES